jgi:hypothetical protein
MAQWAKDKRCKVRYQALFDRLKYGMPAEEAITIPNMHPHDYRLGKVGNANLPTSSYPQ